MLNLKERHLQIIKGILQKYPYTFFAYGSRAKGNNRNFSDLDLCSKDKIPTDVILDIKEELEESDLPFKVDIVSWERMSPTFQKLIEKDLSPIV